MAGVTLSVLFSYRHSPGPARITLTQYGLYWTDEQYHNNLLYNDRTAETDLSGHTLTINTDQPLDAVVTVNRHLQPAGQSV